MELKPGRVLLDQREIAARVDALADEINGFYRGMPIVIVGVLDGCLIFLADLIRRFEMPLELALVKVKTYMDESAPQKPPIVPLADLGDLAGRHVLIVDDIYDTGATLGALKAEITAAGAESVRLCALLEKKREHEREVELDFCGFAIPDVFVVGYGLDYAGRWRNLPHVAVLEGYDETPPVA